MIINLIVIMKARNYLITELAIQKIAGRKEDMGVAFLVCFSLLLH